MEKRLFLERRRWDGEKEIKKKRKKTKKALTFFFFLCFSNTTTNNTIQPTSATAPRLLPSRPTSSRHARCLYGKNKKRERERGLGDLVFFFFLLLFSSTRKTTYTKNKSSIPFFSIYLHLHPPLILTKYTLSRWFIQSRSFLILLFFRP